jgi:hypothetical protein
MFRQNIADLGQCVFKKMVIIRSAGVSIIRAKVSKYVLKASFDDLYYLPK